MDTTHAANQPSGVAMVRSFFVVEFHTTEGAQISRTFSTIRMARKQCAWYASQAWVSTARVMRGGQGALVAA